MFKSKSWVCWFSIILIMVVLVACGRASSRFGYNKQDEGESLTLRPDDDLSISIESLELTDELIQQILSYPTERKIEFNHTERELVPDSHVALIDDLAEIQDIYGGDLLRIKMQNNVSEPYLFIADDSNLELVSPIMEEDDVKCVLTIQAYYGEEEYNKIIVMGATEEGDEHFVVNSAVGDINCIKTKTKTTGYVIYNHCLYSWEIFSDDKNIVSDILKNVMICK